ncbi:hypothetical protein H4P12_07015 [Paracoccus sp. 11-3]|uniref:Uncharacterized protein n=1 Tax=Paracoccus amoyensis TaxID=2760093 RepID=A0A926GDG2_9RHOB|nr:hypothetical protein [Paracoccus amoyensis]MBC9246466.1 hypothetical protein [Paracoccus amoyensis]
MPNHAKIEKDLLNADQAKLVANSRSPAIAALDDAALYDLIAQLEVAAKSAGPKGENGAVSIADLFQSALRRARTERRKRGLKPKSSRAAPATPRKPSARQSPVRKPKDRTTPEMRKDLRTASRRVPAKTVAKAAVTIPTDAIPQQAAKPAAESAGGNATPPPKKTKAPATDLEKAQRKAAKDSARKAVKAAEKEAKKAAKNAEKEAKAARKAAKKIAKKADKAARKAAEKVMAGVKKKKPTKVAKDQA